MSQKAITIYTPASADPHIYAEDDAQIFRALFGGASGITEADDSLACSIINNNTVRLAPGVYSNQVTNLFDQRVKTSSPFEYIPIGDVRVQYTGEFGFQIKLIQMRSEPKWI